MILKTNIAKTALIEQSIKEYDFSKLSLDAESTERESFFIGNDDEIEVICSFNVKSETENGDGYLRPSFTTTTLDYFEIHSAVYTTEECEEINIEDDTLLDLIQNEIISVIPVNEVEPQVIAA